MSGHRRTASMSADRFPDAYGGSPSGVRLQSFTQPEEGRVPKHVGRNGALFRHSSKSSVGGGSSHAASPSRPLLNDDASGGWGHGSQQLHSQSHHHSQQHQHHHHHSDVMEDGTWVHVCLRVCTCVRAAEGDAQAAPTQPCASALRGGSSLGARPIPRLLLSRGVRAAAPKHPVLEAACIPLYDHVCVWGGGGEEMEKCSGPSTLVSHSMLVR